MKNLILLFLFFSFYVSWAQDTARVYFLEPPVSNIMKISKTDTQYTRRYSKIIFSDSLGHKKIYVKVVNAKGNLLSSGYYEEKSIEPVFNTVINQDGDISNKFNRYNVFLRREGYWSFYLKRKQKKVYYSNGKIVNIKT